MITFRSAGDADNFAQLYSGILDKVLPGTTARKVDRLGPAVFAMIGDGAIRYREYLAEVWKKSTIDGTPIGSYEFPTTPVQAAQPRQTSLQPQAAPTPATEAPRTIQAD